MYNPKSLKAEEFIDHQEILDTLAYADENKNNVELIDQILNKARERKGLSHREGRTGDRFMSLCKSGQIQNCCHPNALMTLKEYLMDYAAPETKAIGEKLIQAELENIPKEKVKEICKDHLEKIEQGIRDFRF